MPRKPKRPCSYPGFQELVDGGFVRCMQGPESRRYEKYQRNPETRRR